MQKSDEDIKLFSTDSSLKKNVSLDEIKTTNVNILLNRVKIEKKNDFKKKLYLFSMLSLLVIFFSAIIVSI